MSDLLSLSSSESLLLNILSNYLYISLLLSLFLFAFVLLLLTIKLVFTYSNFDSLLTNISL